MNNELEIKHTRIFSDNLEEYEKGYRYILNQGGSRSSKTYSILQLIIYLCLTRKLSVSIVRQSLPSLRGSSMRDFFEILKELELYDIKMHNMTENIFRFPNGSLVEFFSTVDDQKIRGRKRDILYMNEANEIPFIEFNQLALRTTGSIFMDYNPSDNESYIYELLNDTKKAVLIKSTYLDNIFLGQEQIDYIKNLINIDENYYKIYALGERPIPLTRIYNHFKQYTMIPPNPDDIIYGCDFGYNDPTVLLKIYLFDTMIFVEEILYKSFLTSSDILNEFNLLNINKNSYIYADTARPEIITELRRGGYNMKEANKSVKEGIDAVKKLQVFTNVNSLNLNKEYKMYSWKTNKEVVLDEPLKMHDHCMDALRYAAYTHQKKKFNGKAASIFVPRF